MCCVMCLETLSYSLRPQHFTSPLCNSNHDFFLQFLSSFQSFLIFYLTNIFQKCLGYCNQRWHWTFVCGTASATSTVWHMEVRLLSFCYPTIFCKQQFWDYLCIAFAFYSHVMDILVLHYAHTLWNAVSAGDMVMDGSSTTSWNFSQ